MEQNKLTQPKNILSNRLDALSKNYIFLSFFIPFIGMIVVSLLQSVDMKMTDVRAVFSALKYDGYHQYFPFLKSLRRALLNGESLLWSWELGLGIDYLGLIGYYLCSPFNWISIIIPESWLINYFAFANICRISLAGLFFAIMLKKLFGKNDISIVLFASFYATCAWVFSYMWNTMWMDTFALLPLVFLGTVSLLKERKFALYTIALALSLMTNYYIGFFTCVFTLMTFVVYEVCKWENAKKLVVDFSLMGVFTIIAIGMTVMVTIPVLVQLSTTQSSAATFPEILEINKALIGDETVEQINNIVSQFMSVFSLSDNNNPTLHNALSFIVSIFIGMAKSATNCFAISTLHDMPKDGLPNVYCGVFATIMTVLILTSKSVPKKQRIVGFISLLFFNLSFSCRFIDFLWHGLHFPNSIPYRYSFLYSFLILLIAYEGWLMRKEFKLWQICFAIAVSFVSLGMHTYVFSENANGLFIVVNIALIIAYAMVLAAPIIKDKIDNINAGESIQKFINSVGSITLTMVIVVELVLNLGNCAFRYDATSAYKYPAFEKEVGALINVSDNAESDVQFYRMETEWQQVLNDSALRGYDGASLFSSTANASVAKFAQKLGLQAAPRQNRYTYVFGSPITNLFLNMKYVFANNVAKESQYFQSVQSSGSIVLMQNKYYLPLGFMVNPSLASLSFDDDVDPFVFQNMLVSSAIGENIEPFQILSEDRSGTGSSMDSGTNEIEYELFFEYTADQSGLFCIYYDLPKNVDMNINKASNDIHQNIDFAGLILTGMRAVCQVESGDKILVKIHGLEEEPSDMSVTGAILNDELFVKAYDILAQSPLQLTKFENTIVEGKINCAQDGLLYTSIPYNKNWAIYVDGVETEATLIGDAMIGVELERGEHTLTFKYTNRAFEIGCIVSACSLAVFVAICVMVKCCKKKSD